MRFDCHWNLIEFRIVSKFADFKDRVSKERGHTGYDSYADSSDGFDFASMIEDNEGDPWRRGVCTNWGDVKF